MGNSLGLDLTNQIVVVSAEYVEGKPTVRDRLFLCQQGFGLHNFLSGRAIIGKWLASGVEERIEGDMPERLATDEEAAEFVKKEEEVKPDKAVRE